MPSLDIIIFGITCIKRPCMSSIYIYSIVNGITPVIMATICDMGDCSTMGGLSALIVYIYENLWIYEIWNIVNFVLSLWCGVINIYSIALQHTETHRANIMHFSMPLVCYCVYMAARTCWGLQIDKV